MTYTKHRSTLKARVAEICVVIAFVVVPLSVHAGLLSYIFEAPGKTARASQVESVAAPTTFIDTPLLSALQNPNPQGGRGGAELIVDEGVLVSTGPISENDFATTNLKNVEINVYVVREGDSLSEIAEMFGVTANTILWANDLKSARSIKPGDTLVILPIVGVRHVIKSGDTVASIAKKYKGNAEEILEYNQLPEGEALVVGDTIIVPGGAITPVVSTPAASTRSSSVAASGGSFIHPVPGAVRSQGIHGYNAVDLAAPAGTAIRAAAAGEVIVARSGGWNGGYGNYIVIRHANGTQTLYAHNQSNIVGVGAYVAQGEVIGYVGNTGRSTGAHLHFEVRGARNPF